MPAKLKYRLFDAPRRNRERGQLVQKFFAARGGDLDAYFKLRFDTETLGWKLVETEGIN